MVAPNGIGKTSLVEAAGWALFGESKGRPDDAVRVGATQASAAIELELPDGRLLSVARTLPKRAGRSLPEPVLRLDGRTVDASTGQAALRQAYAADMAFLARLTMPSRAPGADAPSRLGLQDHLGRFFGVHDLQDAVVHLDEMLKDSSKQIRAAKQATPVNRRRLAALRRRAADAAEASAQAEAAHVEAGRLLAQAEARQRHASEVAGWRQRRAAHLESLTLVAERVSAELDRPVAPEAVADLVDSGLDTVHRELEAVRLQRGENRGRRAALLANRERLDAAHDDCPVCRRPLDQTTVSHAHEAQEADLQVLNDQAGELGRRESELARARTALRALRSDLRRIAAPGPRPARPPGGAAGAPVDELQAAASASLDALVAARAAQSQAEGRLAEAIADDRASTELTRLFTTHATVRAMRDTAAATVRELLEGTIAPLAAEIDVRWKSVFPDRGVITTHPDGSITRDVGGETLPYESFSTAESMGALIFLRLLVLQMATRADFCWFDEPLEHLDPDARRQVGSRLARATRSGSIRQVVVTTYEEPLARGLEARDPDGVRLVYVRPRR